MVSAPEIADPGQVLAVTYAPVGARGGMRSLLALDARLGSVVRGGREPMLRQMRLTWWFEALERLDREPPPAEPVLQALAADVLPRGVKGAALAEMMDGWEAITGDEPLTELDLAQFARGRGGRLFDAIAAVCDAADPFAGLAGEGWALADLAGHVSDLGVAATARDMAVSKLAEALRRRWSRNGRAIGAMALLARSDIQGGGGPTQVGRLLWHRMTGR